jgi:hypothetical protein
MAKARTLRQPFLHLDISPLSWGGVRPHTLQMQYDMAHQAHEQMNGSLMALPPPGEMPGELFG